MGSRNRNRNTPRPNVVHRGQRAVLNGKPVIADGKGNWVAKTPGTYGNAQYGGAKAGTYKPGENRKRTPAKTKPTKTKPTYKGPGGNPNGSGQGQAQQAPPAPKLPPKPTAPKAKVSTKVSSPTKTTPKKTSTGPKLTPMQQWAKAHPELAKKVKKGQSGHKELKIGRSTKPRNWLEKNYKPGKKK